jgi:hypothetical protein
VKWNSTYLFTIDYIYQDLVRDSSAVRRLFIRLAGAVGRQSALHKENSGFATPTLGRHISMFRGYQILYTIIMYWIFVCVYFIRNTLIPIKNWKCSVYPTPYMWVVLHSSTARFSHRSYHFAMSVYFSVIKRDLAILTEWWQQRIAWWELLNAECQIICIRKQQNTWFHS